jgi:MFS family permease
MKKHKALNPTVVKLGAVSFFADVASEMLYPITPIFLTTVLGASMASLGLIEGAAEAISSLLKTYSGNWSDRILRRRPFIFFGYLLGAISKPITGVSTGWLGVFAARALDRTGKGLRSAPRDALIADSVAPEFRGAAFGWHRGMDTFGAAIGPLLTLSLLTLNADNLRSLYFWALIPGLLSVLVVLSVRETKHPISKHAWENPFRAWEKFNSSFKRYVYAWGIFSLTNSSDVFLLMKAKSVGLSIQNVVLLYCAYNLTYSLSSPWLGKLSDDVGRKRLMAGGLVIFGLVYLGFGVATASWHFWALFLIYGLYMGATEGVGKALAVDLCPRALRGTSVGLLGTVTGLCTILASTAAGMIWDQFGASWAFFYGAIGAGVSALLLLNVDESGEIEKIRKAELCTPGTK